MSTKRHSTTNGDDSPIKKKTPVAATVVEEVAKTDTTTFYKLEDEIAISMTHTELEEGFLEASNSLREQLKKVIDGEPCNSSVMLNIAKMRRFSRLSHYATAHLRKQSQNRLEQVEGKYLQLQNASSEIQHLQKEINRCLQYSSGDEEIELVPLEEFYSEAPSTISRPEVTKDNEHEQKLARLTWEMSQRKQLVNTLSEQDCKRSVLISDINGKEQRLKSLKPKIDSLIKSAKPVQDVLGVGYVSCSSAEQRSLFSLLPHDLSVIYVQAEAYKDIMEDSNVQVVISGNAEEAIKIARNEENDDGEEDDDEVDGNSKRGQLSVSERLEKSRNTLVLPHPIYLLLTIICQDDISVELKLQYLPGLRVTLLKYKINGKLPIYANVSSEESLLDELFPGDDGVECPNRIGAVKLQQLQVSMSSISCEHGRPYRFVQSLSGSDGQDGRNGGTQLADVLQKVIGMIRSRVSNRLALVKQLKKLESDKWKREPLRGENVPNKVETLMTSFKFITEETYLQSISEKKRILSNEEAAGGFHFLALFENKSQSIKIEAYILVSPDYPNQNAFINIHVNKDGKKHTSDNNHMIQALEHYVNLSCLSENSDKQSMLILQLAHLASRCDVVADLDSQLNTDTHHHHHHHTLLFSKSARGRDGEPPLQFISATNSYTFK